MKVVENDVFGNSEGSDIQRWQGVRIQELISRYMNELGIVGNYVAFFDRLESKQALKARFIKDLLETVHVDYQQSKKKANKIGRNEPCPCGSGKKFKKCCGR